MADQISFSEIAWQNKGKTTKRERFLAEMDAAIPWARLLELLEPHYPKSGRRGRPPLGLERMLRIYFLQHWFALSDPAAEEALYDSESMRRFAKIELGTDTIPDESTILNFRHLLEEHRLTEAIFNAVGAVLEENGLYLKKGTIVDATIVSAPTSTKNADRKRDPEMGSTQKNGSWHYGMKVHCGSDTQGLTHSLVVTSASEADLNVMPQLLHGDEEEIFGDGVYSRRADQEMLEARGVRYRISRRGTRNKRLTSEDRTYNREQSRVRAFGEFNFRTVKHQWGLRKTRYRGLAKNAAWVYAAFALANIYMKRKELGA
jgi:transposase, IS5 family